jgi:microcystin-dependent protein
MMSFGIPLPPGLPAAPLGLPAGSVVAFAGEIGADVGPHVIDIERWGWMVCDGRQLQIAMYPELFAVLGFRYVHQGDPQDMFRIPDYRGYFLRGVSGDSVADPDARIRVSPSQVKSSEVGSIQQHALQNHEHFFQQVSHPTGGTGPAVAGLATEQGKTTGLQFPDGEDHSSPYETRPKNMYIYYIIRYTNGLYGLGAPHLPPMGPPLPGGAR